MVIAQEFAALLLSDESLKHKRSGRVIIQQQFQICYSTLSEIALLVINHVEDNPFDSLSILSRVKK
jgi:hypothetical protein